MHQLLDLCHRQANASAPSLLLPPDLTLCSVCCKVRLGIAFGDDPQQPLFSFVQLEKLTSEAGLLDCTTLGASFHLFSM